MKIEITEKKLKSAIQIAFAECCLEDENLENLIIRYTKELSVFGVKKLTIPVVVKSLPQDNFCQVCNLPTDGVKCYSKRCLI